MEVYILCGDDSFNIEHRAKEIESMVDNEWLQLNYCSMPDDANPFDVVNELLTQSFGGGKKVVRVSNDCLFNKDAKKAIEKLKSASTGNILLITTTKKPAMNMVVVKELLKHGKLEEYQLISMWKTSEIAGYINSKANAYSLNLTNDCIEYLVDNLGNNSQLIDSELQKIALYAESSNVSVDELRLLVKNSNANSIELAKYCLLGESKMAFDKLNQLKNKHSLQVMATLSSCFRTWLAVKAGIAENASNDDISASGCIYNPKRIYFLKQEVSNCSLARLQKISSILTCLEYELKTGKDTFVSRIIEICELK
ncbi:MAG: DNA polymerase III subunit delta [Richelia sp. RM1_1_1]|nr:DNA polymerase III subunit delta [Richelia sp. RM1_1_1]